MNTCSDCKYFDSDPYNIDSCLWSGMPKYPGHLICGEFEPIEDNYSTYKQSEIFQKMEE